MSALLSGNAVPNPDHENLLSPGESRDIPLSCDPEMILYSGQPSQRYHINLVTGASTDLGPLTPSASVNAIGYNTEDSYIYGYDQIQNTIVRVGQNGEVTFLTPRPAGMPAAAYSVGTLDMAGYYYVYAPGTGRFYTVDLRPGSSTFMKLVDPANGYVEQTGNYGTPLSAPLTIGDWAFSPMDGRLYGVSRSGVVYRIDETTGIVTPLSTTGPNPGETFGSVVIDGLGNLYAVNNSDGTIYRYTIRGDSAAGTRFSNTPVDNIFNDAALCPYVVIELDFGDAPDAGGGGGAGNYHTLLSSNGPRHGLFGSLCLGTLITAEEDAHQNSTATGDDLTQGIQDDGLLVPLPLLSVNAVNYSLDVTVTNYSGNTAYLYGWVDFNKNGLFESDEAAMVVTVPGYSGTGRYTLDFTRPAGTVLSPDHTFVRLRLTSDLLTDTGLETQDTRSVGPATDGEVEDYLLRIGSTTDLSLTKTADLPVLYTGDTIRYTITITNNGPEDALQVVLEDQVPPELTHVMYSLDGSPLDYWPGTLSIGTMVPGQVVTVEIQGVFDGSSLGPVINTAVVTSYSDDPNPDNNTATTVTPVNRAANLVITKTSDTDPAVIGEILTFTITVTNNGPDPAENTILTDAVTADFTEPEYSTDGGFTWYPWYGQAEVGTLAVNDIFTLLLRGTVNAGISDTLVNEAFVNSDTEDPDPTDNTVIIHVPKSSSADVAVVKAADPNPVGLGQMLTYTIIVTNSGPSPADQVTIADTPSLLDPEYSLDQFTWLPWPGDHLIERLDSGYEYTLYLRGKVDPDPGTGQLSNTVTVSSPTPDPDPDNNSYTELVDTEDSADLSITKSVSSPAVISGETLTYTIEITNHGPSDAVNVLLSDPLPPFLINPEFSVDGSAYSPWNGQLILPMLAAGASVKILIRAEVLVSQTETLFNTAVVTSDTPDPDPDNNAASAATTASASADLELLKAGPASIHAGEQITYTVQVTNHGPSQASDVTITDAVPPDIINPEFSVNGSAYSAWTGNYTLTALAPLETVILTIRGSVASSASGSLLNTASVSSSTPDPDLYNNTDSVRTDLTASADLSVVKTVSPNPAVPGQYLTYTITVNNAGPSYAENTILEDAVPADLTDVEFSTDGQNWSPWISPYMIGSVEPGDAYILYLRGTVLSFAERITNTAAVTSDTSDPDDTNNSWTVITDVDTQADLSVVKTASPDPVTPGGELTYTIVVSNAGPSDAHAVVLADTAPSLLSNVRYSEDGGTTWTQWPGTLALNTVASQAFATILIQGTVNSAATDTIRNTAIINSTTPDPDPSNNSSTSLTPVETSADLSVIKSAAPTPAVPGQVLTYTVTVHNAGPDTASEVTLTDPIPSELTQAEFSVDGGTSWNPWVSPYRMGTITSGSDSVVLIRGVVNASVSDSIENSVSVSSATPDPDPDNNTFTLITPAGTSADLSVTKTAVPDPAVPGALLTYTITVRNEGPDEAAAVVLTDQTPSVLADPEYSVDGGAYTPWTGSLTLGNLANGAKAAVTIRGTVNPNAAGLLTNRAVVSASTPDPFPDNNTSVAETPLVSSADLSVTKTGSPTPAVPGQVLTYTITVQNAGPSTAHDITVIDALPSALTGALYTVDSSTAEAPWTGTHQIPSLAPGAVTILTIQGTLSTSATGTLRNTVVVTAGTPDPDPTDNRAVDDRPVALSADLSIRKTAAPDPAIPGQYVIYTLTVANAGPADAADITITDALAPVLGNPEYSIDGGRIWNPWNGSFTFGSLTAGTSDLLLLRGLLPATYAGNDPIANTAVVKSDTPDPDPDNNTTTVVTPISPVADLALAKTVSPVQAAPGGILTYHITVSNLGPDTAEDVHISDTDILTELTDVVYSTDSGNSWKAWNGSYTAGNLDSGEQFDRLLLKGIVPADAVIIANGASVSSTTPDPKEDNNTAFVLVPVLDSADLSISKTATPSPAIPGQRITYTLTLVNDGPGTARRITLIDAISSLISDAEYSADHGFTWSPWSSPYQMESLAAGGTAVLLIRGTLSTVASGTIANTAAVVSATPDPDPDNNTSTLVTPVENSADISITKLSHPNPAIPGQYLTYTILAANAGPAGAEDVLLTDPIGNAEYSTDGGVNWQLFTGDYRIGTIEAGTVRRILIRTKLSADAAGSILNTASVSSSTPDPDPDNNSATVETPVADTADLSVTKTTDTPYAHPGDLVTYRIVIRHLGKADAENVQLRDDLPGDLSNPEFSADGGITWAPWTGRYLLGLLPNLETRTLLLRATVTAASGNVSNITYVTSDTPDPDYTNNSGTAVISISDPQNADLAIRKTACSDTVCPGRPAVFHITVVNKGPGMAQNVKILDQLPSTLLNPRYSLNNGRTWSPWTGQLTIGDLTIHSPVTILLAGDVDRCACGTITNKASVTASTADPDPANNEACASVHVCR